MDIYIYMYILESSGALCAPLILSDRYTGALSLQSRPGWPCYKPFLYSKAFCWTSGFGAARNFLVSNNEQAIIPGDIAERIVKETSQHAIRTLHPHMRA